MIWLLPIFPHSLYASLEEWLFAAAEASSDQPLDLVVECEYGLDEEVGGGVETDADEDDPSVVVRSCGPVRNDQVDVD